MDRKIVKHELARIDEGIKIFRVELDCGHVYESTAIGANWMVAFCNKCRIGDLVSSLYMVATGQMKIEQELRSDILLAIAHEQQRRRRRLKLSIGLIVIYWAFLYWLIEAGTAHWKH